LRAWEEGSAAAKHVDTVIASASEAIHFAALGKVDCFVASAFALRATADRFAPRNDVQIHLRILAARCARALPKISLTLHSEGAGMPGVRCARSRAWCGVSTRVSHHEYTGKTPGIPRAMVLTVSFALSRVTGPCCHPRRRKLLFTGLTPASGRQDHTTSPYVSTAVRPRAESARRRDLRPPHPVPTFVTMANVPLSGTGWRELIELICPTRKAEYFS